MKAQIALLLGFTLLLLLTNLSPLSPDMLWADPSDRQFRPVKEGDPTVQEAFEAMLTSFGLYTSLLQDTSIYEGYLISEQVGNPAEARSYLEPGFEAPLASAIAECYLQWLPTADKMAIIPTDGLPLLSNDDYEEISYWRDAPQRITFQRLYHDCYTLGDTWLFSVHLHQSRKGWKIEKFQLLPFARP